MSTRRTILWTTPAVAVLWLTPVGATAQGDGGQWPLFGNLGPHNRTIVTNSDSAQLYFNEGLQLMFAFGPSSARRSFQVAQKYDPDCAMCYWGEAWARSPYLNGRMTTGAEQEAYAAIQKAVVLRHTVTGVDRALIDAFAVRYAAEPTEEMRRPLDTLYMKAMADVTERFPDDLDVAALYGESLMLLRPRRGDVDLNAPDVKRILPILEGVLARNIEHPGACHWYIHLVEASQEPGRAEACADHLGGAIPGASHIRHMPSHIYMNIGRYGDAVRSNTDAWHVDQQANFGGPPGIYPSHNLHMLLFAAVLDGQSAVAIQAARNLGRDFQRSHGFYPAVTLAFFGRWDEVLQLPGPPEDDFYEGMWRYARGMALLRTDDKADAWGELARLRDIMAEIPEGRSFRRHSQVDLLSIPESMLAAELAVSDMKYDDAIARLEKGIEIEDGLEYDEPEPWHFPVRNVLGAILLEADRPVEAEAVYRRGIDVLPGNGWALFGLEQALRAQGRDREADEVGDRFKRAWSRSDVWLRTTRF